MRILVVIAVVLAALIAAGVVAVSHLVVWDDYRYGETSPGIGVPQWWYSIWLPVFSTLITWRAIGLLRRRSRPADVEFIDPPEQQP